MLDSIKMFGEMNKKNFDSKIEFEVQSWLNNRKFKAELF